MTHQARRPVGNAPMHHPGVVTNVHDGRVDVLLFAGAVPTVIPNIQHLPGMELKRGYRVVVSSFQHDCCVVAVIGFMTDEQVTAEQDNP